MIAISVIRILSNRNIADTAINSIMPQNNTFESHPFPLAYQVKYANKGDSTVTTHQPLMKDQEYTLSVICAVI